MQDLPSHGPIADIFFPRLVSGLQREGFEGTIRVTVGDATKVIYVRRGEIASAASNAESDRLANLLIRDGRLTQDQLDMARSRAAAGASLGKTLIEMGFLTPAELLQGARRQVREILASCFTLTEGEYRVEPGSVPPEVTSLGLPTRRLIFDCLVQSADRAWIVGQVGSMESVYKPTQELFDGLEALRLDAEMDRIGRALDGTLTLRDLSGRTALDDFTVGKVVLALEVLGMAELIGEAPAPAAIPEAPAAAPAAPGPREIAVEGSPDEEESRDEDGAFVLDLDDLPESEPPPVSPIGLTPPDAAEETSEPPPIPADELPAFAQPSAEPRWEIDPETGERVHLGPVEVTFDGRIGAPARPAARLTRMVAAAGAVTALLAALFGYLAFRKSDAPDAAVAASNVSAAEAPAIAAADETPAPPPAAEPSPDPAPALAPEPEPSPGAGLPPATRPTPSPVEARPAPARPTVAPPRGSVSPFADGTRYLAALRSLDAGDADRAARLFERLIAVEPPSRLTLQLLIACQADTLGSARARSGDEGSLFFLPYDLRGRSCYRVFWGLYGSRDEAERAALGLPPGLIDAGTRPVVVSVGRLRD